MPTSSLNSRGGEEGIAAELFPIVRQRVPRLRSFQVQTGAQSQAIAGGRLAYRLARSLGGAWVWSASRIVSDTAKSSIEVTAVLEELWRSQPEIFGDVRALHEETGWQPGPANVADFVANGVVRGLDGKLRAALPPRTDLGQVWAEREYEARGWEVSGQPVLSLSVSTRMVHKELLEAYSKRLTRADELVGVLVYDLSSSLKGEVEEVVGSLREHRQRLLAIATRPETLERLSSASDTELVVRVSSGRLGYDYPISSLGLIVRSSDYGRFGVNPRRALSVLKIAPENRWRMVRGLSEVLKAVGWIGEPLRSDGPGGGAFGWSTRVEHLELRFGGNAVAKYDARSLLGLLKRHGLLRADPRFASSPIRVGVVDFSGSPLLGRFLTSLASETSALHLGCDFRVLPTPRGATRAHIEEAVDSFACLGLDLMLGVFADDAISTEYENTDADEWGAYQNLKSLTVGRGIPSQFVYSSTLAKPFAVANVVLGILGKTGNVPFALARPIGNVDLLVGLDIARERKTRLPGSINATAIARIYLGDGEFLRYVIHDAPLEGETIPDGVLHGLFPRKDFQGRTVVVHRDGLFRGGERDALRKWAADIHATFHLVEVIKSGAPRLYSIGPNGIGMPEKGMLVRISEREALLVSSPPPFRDATPQPLRIRTDGSLDLEKAVESVLALTLLHYGSLRPPRLPVTIHYSDKIAYLALRGIKPKDLEGTVPFWL